MTWGYLGPISPNCLNAQIPYGYITKRSDDLGIRIRPHLMLNEELKTLDYFLCVLAPDFGYLGPVFPSCPNTRVPVKQV